MLRISELLRQVDVPKGTDGDWSVERFAVSKADASFFNMRQTINGRGRNILPGKYTRLTCNGTVVMSDTNAEMNDHWEPVRRARQCGRKIDVLINGLGLGVVVQAMLGMPHVEHVTVIEKSSEVMRLVKPHYMDRYGGSRLSVVCADALTWKPPVKKRYAFVWHDIWTDICEDNLPDMHKLHRKYGRRCDWQGSWCRWMCEKRT